MPSKFPSVNTQIKSPFLTCLAGLLLFGLQFPSAIAAELPSVAQFHKDIQPLLIQYCGDCHADGAKKGGVAFDQLKTDSAILNHDLWQKTIKNVRVGLMPPNTSPRPTPEDQKRLEEWIKYQAFGTDPKNPDPGRVTVRRLNRVEYRNTIRDLMGVDFNADAEFPPDDTGYGFDDIGDVLTLSPMLLEKYLAAAKSIVGDTVPMVSGLMPERVIVGSQFRGTNAAPAAGGRGRGGAGGRRGGPAQLAYDSTTTISNSVQAAQAGTYKLTVDLTVSGPVNFDPAKCRVLFKADNHELLNQEFGWDINKTMQFDYEQKWGPGEHALAFDVQPLVSSDKGSNVLQIRINSVTVRGPMEKQLWPKPANYDRFFPRAVPETAAGRRQYARELLGNFATKSFRRPADTKTVDRLVALAEGVYTQAGKTFEAGIAHGMVAVLASPRFLFRIEENVKSPSSSNWALVDEYSLASRLSYFLWSSMPDEELYRLAEKGELRKNLSAQVTRMLADPRSEALVVNFTGQWLQARDVANLTINARAVFDREAPPQPAPSANTQTNASAVVASTEPSAISTNALAGVSPTNLLASFGRSGAPPPNVNAARLNNGNVNGGRRGGVPPPVQLDNSTKNSMRKEMEMFFSNIVHEDRSVMEFIQSDYAFVDANLAKVYGLTNMNIQGTEMRRITLPADSPRGGLLTAGAVLAVTSNPDRTSPVKRGLFVLNNFLGLPVPPPPPNVPALEIAEKDFKDRKPTLREALEVHRQNPLCSSCHSRMDPIGLGMENFNALGVWRDKEHGQAIETAGKLVTGETFNSVQELKNILATNHKADFYRCLTEKLLTYALGRGTEYYDTETVDQIVLRLEKENGRFSALLNGIIESAPFQMRRNQANAIFADSNESPEKSDVRQMAKNQPAK
jgi:Protein of unknown function (DUF1588)/Protein of unknown function (DUF1592)/Protein of unknown function (DUF1587)/Protein of unknown function (DUF1585)/Protein of unknown function (DUF1595)